MITLKDVFCLVGYNTEEEQIALVQLMLLRHCFSNPELYFSNHENIETKALVIKKSFAKNANQIWRKYPTNSYTDSDGITRTEFAKNYLFIQFESLIEGYLWLYNITQLFLLREDFFNEGQEVEIELKKINTTRWFKQKIKISELKNFPDSDHLNRLYYFANQLHFIKEYPWPKKRSIRSVVIFGSTDEFIEQRINFIPYSFRGKFYFLSGCRGAFRFEPSLPFILAEWSNRPDKLEEIKQLLKKHEILNDRYEWTMDLPALKQELMQLLDLSEWLKAPQSYYYQNKELYDIAATRAGRPPLDCLGGPWPVAADIAYFYLKKRREKFLAEFKDIEFVPVVALGKNNRLTNMEDCLEAWHEKYGKEMIANGETPVFVSDNMTHDIPFAIQNIYRRTGYRDEKLKKQLKENLINFLHNNQLKQRMIKINIAGPSAQEFCPSHFYDSLAKKFFTLKDAIFLWIEEHQLSLKISIDPTELYARQLIMYHLHQHFLLLVNASISLAHAFFNKQRFIKASGLIHFAMNVFHTKMNHEKNLISLLTECTVVIFYHFICYSLSRLDRKNIPIDFNQLRQYLNNNKTNLNRIRKKILNEFTINSPATPYSISELYNRTYQSMSRFLIELITQAESLLGKSLDTTTIALLGSYSDNQMTPYSDIEFCTIIKNPEDGPYARRMAECIIFLIINLGETVKPSLGIEIVDSAGNVISLNKHDGYTHYGLSPDGNFEGARKTSLGGPKYRLIGTPAELACKFSGYSSILLDPYLFQLIRHSRFLYGDRQLFNDCQNQLRQAYDPHYIEMLFRQDLEKYIPIMKDFQLSRKANHKKYIYRPINIIIKNLFSLLNLAENPDGFKKLDLLCSYGMITPDQKKILYENLFLILYVRISQHFKHQKQQIDLSEKELFFSAVEKSGKRVYKQFLLFHDKLNHRDMQHAKKSSEMAHSLLQRRLHYL